MLVAHTKPRHGLGERLVNRPIGALTWSRQKGRRARIVSGKPPAFLGSKWSLERLCPPVEPSFTSTEVAFFISHRFKCLHI